MTLTHSIKRIAFWSLGLLLLMGVGVAALMAVAGDDFYRWITTRLVERSIAGQVHVDGTFRFDVGLKPVVTITDVWIENTPWAEQRELAKAERVDVQFDLRSVVRGALTLPRLVVEGASLNLETSADGRRNWDIGKPGDDDKGGRGEPFIPVFGLISVNDVAITHTDRGIGQKTELLVEHFHKDPSLSGDDAPNIKGTGSFNQNPFEINGRVGSIEDALAAAAPFPIELTLETLGLSAEITGTVGNVVAGTGVGLRVSMRSPSISQVAENLGFELAISASADGTARLSGDLASLSIEELKLVVGESPTHALRVEGSLADLPGRKGLDLQFSGQLGPQTLRATPNLLSNASPDLRDMLTGATRLEIAGRVAGDAARPGLEDLQARLTHRSGGELSLAGRAALDRSKQRTLLTRLDATCTAFLPDPALAAARLGTELPDVGALRANAELSVVENGITLRSFEVRADSFAGLRLRAVGRIGKLSEQAFGIEVAPRLDLSLSMQHSRPLIALLVEGEAAEDDVVEPIQQALASVGLKPGPADGKMGPQTRAAIEAYQARHGLAVNGQATRSLLRHVRGELVAHHDAVTTNGAPAGTPSQIPDLGPVAASGRLIGGDGVYRLERLNLAVGESTGPARALAANIVGEIGDVLAMADIALEANLNLPTSKFLHASLPDVGAVSARATLLGSSKRGSVEFKELTAGGRSSLLVLATGRIDIEESGGRLDVASADLRVRAESDSTRRMAAVFQRDLPELGEFTGGFRLQGTLAELKATEIQAVVKRDDDWLVEAAGSGVQILPSPAVSLEGAEIALRATVPSTRVLAEPLGIALGDLGELAVSGRLSQRGAAFALDGLELELAKAGILSLRASGSIGDLFQGEEVDVRIDLNTPEPQAVAALFGHDVGRFPSLQGSGRVRGGRGNAAVQGSLTLGETVARVDLTGDVTGERPSITGEIAVPVLHLRDIDIAPLEAQQGTSGHGSRGTLFSERRWDGAALRTTDVELALRIDEIVGKELSIDKADMAIRLDAGALRINPATLEFGEGDVSVDFGLDARDTARALLKLRAKNVSAAAVLERISTDVPARGGRLNFFADLESAGDSPHAIASNLNGRFGFTAENVKVLRRTLDVLAVDVFGWSIRHFLPQEYDHLDCTIGQITATNGLLTIDEFYSRGQDFKLRGKGTLDLRSGALDVTLNPKKARRLVGRVTPIKIDGHLESPEVRALPLKEVGIKALETVLTPPTAVPLGALDFLSSFVADRKNSPCLTAEW